MDDTADVVRCFITQWAAVQIEALNHALRGIPEDRIRYRYHICWGSWHGAHKSASSRARREVLRMQLK